MFIRVGMVLVLALGDLHILHRAPDLPAKFMSMLAPGKDPAYIVCTGNLCIKVKVSFSIQWICSHLFIVLF